MNITSLSSSYLSALIITYNEEINIYRTLDSIRWIPYVLVLDSGSTDSTIDIASTFSNTEIIHRDFDTFAKQCNFGLSCLSSDWVLSLDADYVLSKALSKEIQSIILESRDITKSSVKAYSIRFRYCINGKPIRSGALPPRTCLYKRDSAYYFDEGHGHRIAIKGVKKNLRNTIFHDDRKSVNVWLMNQKKYQSIEARDLIDKSDSELPIQDLLRKHTCLAPLIFFLYCFILRGGFLDGKEGIIYALQRVIAESLLYLNINMSNNHKSGIDQQKKTYQKS